MKKQFQHLKLFLPALIIMTALSSHAQKQFTHTATKANNSCNGDCTLLDVPELNDNPAAIIMVTPLIEKGLNLNPHPIGVYYIRNKWNIFNLDQRAIPAGAKFNVEYVTRPDPNHFQYLITTENLQKDGSAFIDHPALNDKPDVQFRLFVSWMPEVLGGNANRDDVSIQFKPETGKWYLSNVNKKPLFQRVTYNISISSGGNTTTNPVSLSVVIPELVITPTNSNSTSGAITLMYMTVWANGTKLPGDNVRAAFLDKTHIWGFEMAVSSLSSSGQVSASGKRIYEPITIKFHSGWPAAILLLDAFVKNQNMAFTVEAFSNTDAGLQLLNYTIKLTGARIVSFKQSYEEMGLHLHQGSNGVKKYYDEIKIMFTQIEYTNSVGVTAIDNL